MTKSEDETNLSLVKMNGNSYFESEGINMAFLMTGGTVFGILGYWLAFVVHDRLEKWNLFHYGDVSRSKYDTVTIVN